MPSGGIALASGTATAPVYGCSYNGTCYLGAPIPRRSIIPPDRGGFHHQLHVRRNSRVPGGDYGECLAGTDGHDYRRLCGQRFPAERLHRGTNATGTQATFTLPSPAPNPLDQPVDSTAVGYRQATWFCFKPSWAAAPGPTTGYAVGEVTNPLPTGTGPSYTVNFTTADPLQFNQIDRDIR